MKELSKSKREKLNAMLCDLHEIARAKIVNGVEQMYEQHGLQHADYERLTDAQRWTTKRIKSLPEWAKVSEPQKVVVSQYMDYLCMDAQGVVGCTDPKSLKAYYKPEHHHCTPIMPAKLVL